MNATQPEQLTGARMCRLLADLDQAAALICPDGSVIADPEHELSPETRQIALKARNELASHANGRCWYCADVLYNVVTLDDLKVSVCLTHPVHFHRVEVFRRDEEGRLCRYIIYSIGLP